MKNILRFLMAMLLVISLENVAVNNVSASSRNSGSVETQIEKARIKVNGKYMEFESAFMDLKSGVIYVSAKNLADYLGAALTYTDNKSPLVFIINKSVSHRVSVTLNSSQIVVDGETKKMDGTVTYNPSFIEKQIMVPVVAVAKALGTSIEISMTKNKTQIIVAITAPWITPTWEWKLGPPQKTTGTAIFKSLKWDPSTRTISFEFPSTIDYKGENWNISGGFNQGFGLFNKNKTSVPITGGKPYIFKNVSQTFRLYVTIDYPVKGGYYGLGTYYILSKDFATKQYGFEGAIDDELLVRDSYNRLVTLETVYKALGLK